MNGIKFGIVITTYNGDLFFTRGLLASIKYFMPQVPICIIQDGDFSLDAELKVYNIVEIIKKGDVENEYLRENCFGTRSTNMVAFWQCPFDYFLFLDSDTIIWGNIVDKIMPYLFKYDFIHNLPHEEYTDEIYKNQYFDPQKIFKHVPIFDWRKCHFFNSGVFVAKKDMFNFDEFVKLYELWKKDSTLMFAPPQSIINMMLYNNLISNQDYKIKEISLQEVVAVKTLNFLKNEYEIKEGKPLVKRPIVIHWAGEKPSLKNKNKVYKKAMMFFRRKNLFYEHSYWRFLPYVYMLYEEVRAILDVYYGGKFYNWIYRKIKCLCLTENNKSE